MNDEMHALQAAHDDLLLRLQALGFGTNDDINGGDVVDAINAWLEKHHINFNLCGGDQ